MKQNISFENHLQSQGCPDASNFGGAKKNFPDEIFFFLMKLMFLNYWGGARPVFQENFAENV